MAKATTKRRRKSSGRSASKSGGMAPWYLAAALTIGGVVAYDHRSELRHWPVVSDVMAFTSQQESRPKPVRAAQKADERPGRQAESHAAKPATKVALAAPVPAVNVGVTAPTPVVRPNEVVSTASIRTDQFYFCGIRTDNCVIDGATFLYHGETIRVADIDAPRIRQASCDKERSRGFYAKQRLRELLNAGDFRLVAASGRPSGKDGEKLRFVTRGSQSIGGQLVSEGLVRPWTGHATPWC
ncbi:MAG TPA: thermonuclease family protein [Ensifer sp.]|jgi:endonuclease YncB( thermonuclease family)|uniref:thermonuclease family protein n=1 Tax=Ensifer sp. TaxID=1872086 RepID=UPI002E144AC5|nr:thermonuclease family protein [Ensifer sp.]